MRRCGKLFGVLLTGSMFMGTAGCGLPPGYLPSVVGGELAFLSGMTPIEVALADPRLTDEQREKLAFVVRARDYAEQVVGLEVGNNFRDFVYIPPDEALAFNLSASRKDRIEAYQWNVPIAGWLPYLGFFSEEEITAERDRLVAEGWDTFIYEVDAFALWGLPDPVTSPLLDRSYAFLADVVMHELLHNTVFKIGDDVFSESLAVFVGRTAGMEFLAAEFGADSEKITEARQRYEDDDRLNTHVAGLVDDLQSLYGSDLSSEEKIAARDAVFEAARLRFVNEVLPQMNDSPSYESFGELKLNNAYLLVNVRYNSEQEVFEATFDSVGRDWSAAMAVFAQASAADDPIAFLQERLADSP